MAAEWEALAAMLVVRANAAREAALMAAQEKVAMEAERVAEEASVMAAQEEAARATAGAKELAEEAATDAAAQTELARDRRCRDEYMTAARRAREIHELASECRHRRNLAHARQTDDEGSNAVDAGWGDTHM
jgi:hypothetical protein